MAQDNSGNLLNGAEAMVRMLEAHGVRHIFGLCGDTTLPFYDALYRLDHGIEHILTRDERSAAYMADGYARVTHKPGICEGPSGGGATYILPGLVEANESSVPILSITSDVAVSSRGHYPLTELDQDGLMRPLTKWNAVIGRSDMLPDLVRAAFRAMTTGRPGAAHLGFPIDVQRDSVDPDTVWAEPRHTAYPAFPAAPPEEDAAALLDALLSARFPAVVCGGGIVLSGGEAEFRRFVERLDIVVATTVSGQGSLPETHSEHRRCGRGERGRAGDAGTAGGRRPGGLFIGCRAGSVTTERWRVRRRGATRVLHLDSDPQVIAASYRTEAAMVCDARLGLAGAEPASRQSREAPDCRLRRCRGGVAPAKAKQVGGVPAELAAGSGSGRSGPSGPSRHCGRCSMTTPSWWPIPALRAPMSRPTTNCAPPGAPCSRTGRTVRSATPCPLQWAPGSGDRSARWWRSWATAVSRFTCGEFETVVRRGMPITFIVFSNAVFGWIKAGQRTGFGERYFSVDFDRSDHAAIASAFGVKSWRVEDPDALEVTLRRAVAHDGPTLVDVISQPLNEAAAPVSEWIA